MLFAIRLLLVGVLGVGLTAATTAEAGIQLFEGSWTVKAFGNELTGGTGASEYYSAWGNPGGNLCNPYQPRCPFASTPTDGKGKWAPLGGTQKGISPFCTPWANWQGFGTTARPAKGATATKISGLGKGIPPFYRNYAFFTNSTPNAAPNTTMCSAKSTGATPGGKGLVQAGKPATGTWSAVTTGTQLGGFSFTAAPSASGAAGIRATGVVAEFEATYPYVYSYTYADLRNDYGVFGPGSGPGSFKIPYVAGSATVARVNVKQGGAKFGGTMRMLGAMTSKVCYYRNGGCSLGGNNWRYDAVGATAYTSMGVVTGGYIATYSQRYYHTALMQTSTVQVAGERFPWTTGSVTVTAKGRGPHKTVHYAKGFDNRNTTTPTGKGTVQLVTPVLTHWTQPCCELDTGGVGILRLRFVPEPQAWVMLVVGASLLGVGHRVRRR